MCFFTCQRYDVLLSVPARIVNISENVSVNEGENVNLYCLAVGRPEPTVTWKDQKCEPCSPARRRLCFPRRRSAGQLSSRFPSENHPPFPPSEYFVPNTRSLSIIIPNALPAIIGICLHPPYQPALRCQQPLSPVAAAISSRRREESEPVLGGLAARLDGRFKMHPFISAAFIPRTVQLCHRPMADKAGK